MHDLVISGGTVVAPDRVETLDLAIDGERIAEVGPPRTLGEASRTIDAGGCLVMPGGVDPHVHYSLSFGPVTAESQDFCHAAALGGTTTVIDFALQRAPSTLHQAIEEKKAEAEGRMAVDWGLHAILAGPEISFEVMEEIGDVIRAGIPTIKTFTTYDWMCDDGYRFGVMSEVAEHGGMSVVHAEDDAIAGWQTRKYVREGRTHGAYISEVRDAFVEEAAVRRCMLLAERSGSPLYVLHMAAGSAVEALAEGRRRGLPLYGETLTPYLSFTQDVLWDDDSRGLLWNNYPTLKTKEDQRILWEAVADDRLCTIGSDHFALSVEDKYERMGTRVDGMMAGWPNVELRLPVVWHLGPAQDRISPSRFVELVSANPAKLMGLYPRKGALEPGSDADVVVLDPRRSWTVHHEELGMSSDYSPWEGWELEGRITTTILRGSVIVEDGQFTGARDGGRFLERSLPTQRPDLSATHLSDGVPVLGSAR